MHKYPIGQKVRCIKTENPNLSRFIGDVFVVVKHVITHGKPGYELEGCYLPLPFVFPGIGDHVMCQWAEEHVEPVNDDDGRQVVDWAECPWKPEHIRDGVAA